MNDPKAGISCRVTSEQNILDVERVLNKERVLPLLRFAILRKQTSTGWLAASINIQI